MTTEAMRDRDQALAQVAGNAHQDERESVERALDAVVSRGGRFTTDAVIAEMGDLYRGLREPRLLGAILQAWRSAGRIIPTGEYQRSTRRECHARPVMVWRVT